MKFFRNSMLFAMALAVSVCATSCSDSNSGDDDSPVFSQSALQTVNKDFVNKTVIPTYRNLANYNKQLVADLNAMTNDVGVAKACESWKGSRKWWEFSEAFLFGPAGDFSIDPHTDTWPFDKKSFDNYMAKYHPATNESDAALIDEAIANGKNLTGFHAVEYLIFRDGNARNYADMTADEIYFAKSAAQDLYLSSLKLVSAWGGEVSDEEQALLDEAEFESKDYGADFIKAGQAGSSYSTVLLASCQIIDGANEIIGEVRDSKIGAPATGEDVNYIESPYSYNSIQDFYDNIMSCKHTLYGGCTVDGTTPQATSLIGICLQNDATKEAAQNVMTNMENALAKISIMKPPFVLFYQDQSALDAMTALEGLESSLNSLKAILEKGKLN